VRGRKEGEGENPIPDFSMPIEGGKKEKKERRKKSYCSWQKKGEWERSAGPEKKAKAPFK